MNNSKTALALLIAFTALQIHGSEFYVSQSETESIGQGRKPKKPLTMPLEGAISKKQRENKPSSVLDKKEQKKLELKL